MTTTRPRTFECTFRFIEFLVIGILVEDLVFADSNNEQYIEPILLQQKLQQYNKPYQYPSMPEQQAPLPDYIKWHYEQEKQQENSRLRQQPQRRPQWQQRQYPIQYKQYQQQLPQYQTMQNQQHLMQQHSQLQNNQYYQQPSQLTEEIDPSKLPEYLRWHHQQEQAKQKPRAPPPPPPARKSGGIMSTLYRFLVSPTSSVTGGVGNQPQIRVGEYGMSVNGSEEWESVDPRMGQLKTAQRSPTYRQPPPFSARSFTQSQLSRGKQATRGAGDQPLFLNHDPSRPSPPKNMYDWIVHPLKPILVVKKYQYQPLILPRKDTNFYWRCKYNWGIPFGITCAVMIGNLLALAVWTYIQIQPVEIPLRPGEATKKDWRLLLNLFKFGN